MELARSILMIRVESWPFKKIDETVQVRVPGTTEKNRTIVMS